MRPVLAMRDFRLMLVACGASMLGDFLAVIALTVRVQEATGAPALFALLPRVVGEELAPRASGVLEAARYPASRWGC